MSVTGGCQCGNIKYSFEGEPVGTSVCHCTDCRRSTGGTNTTTFLILKHSFKSTGTPKVFIRKGDAGTDVRNHFCGDCGSPLWTTTASLDQGGIMIIRCGTLDDQSLNEKWRPRTEIFCRRRFSWQPAIQDAQQFDAMMPF